MEGGAMGHTPANIPQSNRCSIREQDRSKITFQRMQRNAFCVDLLVQDLGAVERLIGCVDEAEDPAEEEDGGYSNGGDGF